MSQFLHNAHDDNKDDAKVFSENNKAKKVVAHLFHHECLDQL